MHGRAGGERGDLAAGGCRCWLNLPRKADLPAYMKQLAATSRLLARRAIQGVIFHCTPLVDMDLDAVRLSKAWIRENAARAY